MISKFVYTWWCNLNSAFLRQPCILYLCVYVWEKYYPPLVSSEESSAVPGVGVEKLVETKRLDFLKDGPLFWVDSADSQPCMGTWDKYTIYIAFFYRSVLITCWSTGSASAVMWTLRVEGRLFHSGLPHKGINSLELAMEATAYIQKKFYQDFPPVSVKTYIYCYICSSRTSGSVGW